MPGMYNGTICSQMASTLSRTGYLLSVRHAYYTAAARAIAIAIAAWQLAARVLKDIEIEQRAAEVLRQQEEATRELLWARSCRDILLMRHPTNWAGASLLQVLL